MDKAPLGKRKADDLQNRNHQFDSDMVLQNSEWIVKSFILVNSTNHGVIRYLFILHDHSNDDRLIDNTLNPDGACRMCREKAPEDLIKRVRLVNKLNAGV